ncbi:hypothetical protein ACF0H5_011962 [Mactra antiquata]
MSGKVARLVLILLCACAAVNILFYSLTFTSLKKDYHGFSDTDEPDGNNGQRLGKRLLLRENQKKSNYIDQLSQTSPELLLFTFSINNYSICYKNLNGNESDWDLVIVVISKAENFIRRHAIRNTWGSELRALNTQIVFLVGIDENSNIQKQIQKEAELYNDVIQVDLHDTYRNLTRKSIAMLQWLADYCQNSKFYLKADDDMYVNINNVIQALKQIQQQRFFFCHVFKEAPPIREESSKWYISVEEFGGKFFPTYCSGTTYAYSSAILADLLQSAEQKRIISLEDIYITGMAAEDIDITHIHSEKFSFYKQKPTGCTYEHLFAGHEVSVDQMFIIHSEIKSREIDCDTKQNKYLLKVENE